MNVEDAEIEALEFRAKQFRAALEHCERDLLPIAFENFPRGSCGDATLLLAKYLQNSGLGFFDYICGEVYEDGGRKFQSHAWLQRGNIIVDITADQFNEIEAPVLVTRDHSWHNQFEVEVKNVADYEVYDERTKRILSSAYESVIACIDDI
jgi:hypothetical protein